MNDADDLGPEINMLREDITLYMWKCGFLPLQ